jgi:hypothetical protein
VHRMVYAVALAANMLTRDGTGGQLAWSEVIMSKRLALEVAVTTHRSSNWGGYDYIVIGAGSAGCVVEARFAENPEV